MDQQKFFNYYTELLNRTVQDLFNKSIILQTNEKLHLDEITSLKKQLETVTKPETEQEIFNLKKELLEARANEETYREELQKAKERLVELENNK